MTFVLSRFDPHLSFFWCPGKAVHRDCGISWIAYLYFVRHTNPKVRFLMSWPIYSTISARRIG